MMKSKKGGKKRKKGGKKRKCKSGPPGMCIAEHGEKNKEKPTAAVVGKGEV